MGLAELAKGVLVSLLMPSCFLTLPKDPVRQTAPLKMEFHRLQVTPLLHSAYPTYQRYHDGLAPQIVVITVEGLERVGWETHPEKACWILRLPEQIFVSGKKLHYQVGMDWTLDKGQWSYSGSPVKDLLGLWIRDPEQGWLLDSASEKKPILGRQDARIYVDSTGVHYSLGVTNISETVWKDVYTWICLSHSHVPATGYRPYLKIGSSWKEYQKISHIGPADFLPVDQKVIEYSRIRPGSRIDPFLTFPGVVCWNIVNNGHLLTAHLSQDSLAVLANQLEPCTDLFLWFGDIEPGERTIRNGHVIIARSSLEIFQEQEKPLLRYLEITSSGAAKHY